jgi:hypothetical protein
MSSDDIAIKVDSLSKRYQIYDRPNDRLKRLVGKITKLMSIYLRCCNRSQISVLILLGECRITNLVASR